MYVSRTQFCLVVRAICYIVLSSANSECPIPEGGYVCKVNPFENQDSTSTIWLGMAGMYGVCSTENHDGKEMIAAAIEFNLDIDGDGNHVIPFPTYSKMTKSTSQRDSEPFP